MVTMSTNKSMYAKAFVFPEYCNCLKQLGLTSLGLFFFSFFVVVVLFLPYRAAPMAYGGFQAGVEPEL